jgi:uncharacterized ferritin-like protein (DUF455 family)
MMEPGLSADGPARDERFRVVERWSEMANLPDDHPEKPLEFLHRQMNEEANVLENAARSLVQFPDAEWEIRKWLARQCADEARHVEVYRRLLERRGGRVGQYPVMNFQYKILGTIDNLVGRLAVQNRTFEADGLDAAVFGAAEARQQGDEELAQVYESQSADEVLHVRFANEYIRRKIQEDGRNALRMAAALTRGSAAFQQVFADGGTEVSKYGIAEQERLEAGFAPQEIAVAVEQAETRRQAARERRA